MLKTIAAMILGLCFLVHATTLAENKAAGPRLGEVFQVNVEVGDHAGLQRLVDAGYNIDNYRWGVATVYATSEELAQLDKWGYTYTLADPTQPPPFLYGTEELYGADDLEKAAAVYRSYQSLTSALQTYAAQYTAIARLTSLGQSSEDRELWAMLISDNPGAEEDEPEAKYVSTIHGDEPVGTEMLLMLIHRLLSDYGLDDRITDLVDGTAIWIVPLMNPDGYVGGTRANAEGIDLNRSFPDWPEEYNTATVFTHGVPDLGLRPLEVAHVMAWTLDNSFTLSASFHTGALLVNYPYDDTGVPSGINAPTPDDALFRNISLRYSMNNPRMFDDPNDPDTPDDPDGITNGSAWYVIEGGMQDWNYRYAGVNEVTVELSNVKQPSASSYASIWQYNEESMLTFLEAAHIGIRGVVTDLKTGQPVYAQVNVVGNAHPVYTDPDVGDYHRMLLPGTYTLSFSALGYSGASVGNVVVKNGAATRVDVELTPIQIDADIDNRNGVNAVDVQLVVNAVLGIDIGGLNADVDNSGSINAVDVQLVVNAVLNQ